MASKHKVVSKEEWLTARENFLRREKAFTHERAALSAERRELPWLKIDKDYVFKSETGDVRLSELFDGKSQLIIYHFMFAPEWTQGCMGCSFMADHFNPSVQHIKHRDVAMAAVSRAPVDKLLAFRKRMGWNFQWVSSQDNDFNRDFNVSFTEAENKSGLKLYNYGSEAFPISDAPGMSAFVRDESGDIYLTYSTYARGLDIFLTAYHLLDITAKGRGENEDMNWVRHHDRYDREDFVEPWVEVPVNSVRA